MPIQASPDSIVQLSQYLLVLTVETWDDIRVGTNFPENLLDNFKILDLDTFFGYPDIGLEFLEIDCKIW